MKIFEKSNNELGAIYIAFESPVKNEDPHLKGMSHLLEHMICCSLDDVEEKLDEHCLTYNAYTGGDEVVFFLSGLSSELAKFRDLFVERILNYKPQIEHFNKEKNIVLQEYDDAYSESGFSSFANYSSLKFGYVGPIGVRSAIEEVTFEQICDLHTRAFARPSKIIVIDRDDLEVQAEFADTSSAIYTGFRHVNHDAPVVPSSINVLSASPILPLDGVYHLQIIQATLGYGLKSPLYQELREKASLCYWVSASAYKMNDDHIMVVSTSTKDSNVDRIKGLTLDVLSNPEKHFTRERFDMMMANRRIAIRIAEQNLASSGFRKHLNSANEKVSFLKNIDRITYDSALDYFNRHLNPRNVAWEQVDDRDIRQMT